MGPEAGCLVLFRKCQMSTPHRDLPKLKAAEQNNDCWSKPLGPQRFVTRKDRRHTGSAYGPWSRVPDPPHHQAQRPGSLLSCCPCLALPNSCQVKPINVICSPWFLLSLNISLCVDQLSVLPLCELSIHMLSPFFYYTAIFFPFVVLSTSDTAHIFLRSVICLLVLTVVLWVQ